MMGLYTYKIGSLKCSPSKFTTFNWVNFFIYLADTDLQIHSDLLGKRGKRKSDRNPSSPWNTVFLEVISFPQTTDFQRQPALQ